MYQVDNEYGIINARKIGEKGVATHRDPKTGKIWVDGYDGPNENGVRISGIGWWYDIDLK